MIRLENLHKRFGKQPVLQGLSFSMEQGQAVALMGPNGSGKTTLIKSILGMVKPDSGKVFFDNQDVAKEWAYREHIGYMPQAANFPPRIKVKELFTMMRDIRKKENSASIDTELLEQYELDKIYDKRIGTLSGGTKQKVSAALAFMFRPQMLILDEPTTGLDPVSAETLKAKIISEREAGRLIFVSSHIMSDVEEVSSHVMYLFEGKIKFIMEMDELKSVTGETSLNKAIVQVMSNNIKQPAYV